VSQDTTEIRQPSTGNRPLQNIVSGVLAGLAALVAYDLKLVSLLAARPRTLPEICESLNIAQRPAESLLAACTFLELVQVQDGLYSLTLLAKDYLLETSPTYFGGYLDFVIMSSSLYTFESLKKAVLANASPIYSGEGLPPGSQEAQAAFARLYTQAMHGLSMAAALAWPEFIDLTGYRLMFDVGGGSGAHAISAVQKWPVLKAIVLDFAPVCEVAKEYIAHYGLQDQIVTQAGDMWDDPFPTADIHFYSAVYHNWPPERCRLLTQKSFESLESEGRIIIHEMLYNDEKTGSLGAIASGLAMLLFTKGQQYSGRELSAMLTEAGFTNVEIESTFGDWSIVTAHKP
jgi:ubiquinone/menaquinone biosynthesis C-methylase UbiE